MQCKTHLIVYQRVWLTDNGSKRKSKSLQTQNINVFPKIIKKNSNNPEFKLNTVQEEEIPVNKEPRISIVTNVDSEEHLELGNQIQESTPSACYRALKSLEPEKGFMTCKIFPVTFIFSA